MPRLEACVRECTAEPVTRAYHSRLSVDIVGALLLARGSRADVDGSGGAVAAGLELGVVGVDRCAAAGVVCQHLRHILTGQVRKVALDPGFQIILVVDPRRRYKGPLICIILREYETMLRIVFENKMQGDTYTNKNAKPVEAFLLREGDTGRASNV